MTSFPESFSCHSPAEPASIAYTVVVGRRRSGHLVRRVLHRLVGVAVAGALWMCLSSMSISSATTEARIEDVSQLDLFIFGPHGESSCCLTNSCYIGVTLCNVGYTEVDLAPLMVPQAYHLSFYVVGPWGEWLPFEGPERSLNYPQRTQLEPGWCFVDQHDIAELFPLVIAGTYGIRAIYYDPMYGFNVELLHTAFSSVLQLKMKRKKCEGKGMAQPLEPPEDIDYFERVWAIKKRFVGLWLSSRAYPLAILF